MNSVEKTGKTVKEATDLALSELNVKEDDAIIEVLDEGNKGIFGLFNTRMAKVKVTVKKRISHEGKEFLQALLKKMDLEAQVEVRENEDTIIYNIISKDGGVIIGRRGETLDAIQFLTGLVVNKNSQQDIWSISNSSFSKENGTTRSSPGCSVNSEKSMVLLFTLAGVPVLNRSSLRPFFTKHADNRAAGNSPSGPPS
jgi:predicted RNA-binding protein YlqC (UPF0109 family)